MKFFLSAFAFFSSASTLITQVSAQAPPALASPVVEEADYIRFVEGKGHLIGYRLRWLVFVKAERLLISCRSFISGIRLTLKI
jgi:hypothetical protein